MARIDVGKPIPRWLDPSWQEAIDTARKMGYGLLPDGIESEPGDRGWWVKSGVSPESSGWTCPGWVAAAPRTVGLQDDGPNHLLCFRMGFKERGVAVIPETSHHTPFHQFHAPRHWSCGHRRDLEDYCVVCAVFGRQVAS